MQQSKSQLSLAPSSVAQSLSAFSTHELSSHAYWLFKKEVQHFSINSLEDKGRKKKEILWTGLRAPEDAAAVKLIRAEDPVLLCTASEITGILEATCECWTLHCLPFSDPITNKCALSGREASLRDTGMLHADYATSNTRPVADMGICHTRSRSDP